MSDLIRYRDDVEWPLNIEGAAKLWDEGVMHSPTIYNSRKHHVNPAKFVPFANDRNIQLRQTLEVLQRRHAAKNNLSGVGLPCFRPGTIYHYFGITTATQGAESVRAEDPAWHPTHARQYLHDNGVPLLPVFSERLPQDFSNGPLPVAACMDALPYMVTSTVFAVKYYWGIARPEQIIQRWMNDEIDVPDWFNDALVEMGVGKGGNARDWMQYGHPPHPDFTAMHSAVAVFGYAAQAFFDFTNHATQLDDVLDYQEEVAHNRDTGGVHSWDASHQGMAIGMECIKKELPKLVRHFGGNADMVSERLANVVER